MKNKIKAYWLHTFVIISIIFVSTLIGCGGSSTGVEAGNPVVTGKTVTITPTSGTTSYKVTIVDDDTAIVTQMTTAATASTSSRAVTRSSIVDTDTVTYSESDNVITLTATFSDGTTVVITLTFNSDGELTSGAITVDGVAVDSTFAETSTGNHAGTAEDALAAGFAAFEDRDVATAEDEYCNELLDNPANSSLAFGCFWAKMMLLPETAEADTLLAVFDEDPFDLDTMILGEDGFFANLDDMDGSRFPIFNYTAFDLPFAAFFSSVSSLSVSQRYANLLQLAIDNAISVSQIQTMIGDLIPHFTELESLIAIVVADTSFTFTLPQELYRWEADIDVNYTDVQLFAATVIGTIAGLNQSMAYDIGVDIDNIVVSGDIDQEILVADLNGTGETIGSVTVDTTAFLTLNDADRITNTENRFLSSLTLQKSGLQNLADGEAVSDFTKPTDEYNLVPYIEFLDQLIDSINNGMTDVFELPGSSVEVQIDLQTFFASPPDASSLDASAGDPFVLEDGTAAFVESYFEDFFDGIVVF